MYSMKRNTGLVLFIILLTIIATSLGYYFGKRASFPNNPTESIVAI
jgi:predicted permease